MRSLQKTLVSFLLSAAMLMTAAVPAVLAAEGDAAAALNGAGDIVEVQAVLEQYGDELDLDLETLSKISKKDAVYQAMLDAEFATDADVQKMFAQALGEQAAVIKNIAVADARVDWNNNIFNDNGGENDWAPYFMINRLVYTETVPMTAEGGQWGTIDLKTGAKTQGADPWLFVPGWAQRYNQAYFTFDQTATYGKEHIVGAQANLRRGYEESAQDGVARYLLLYDDTETRNAIGFSNDTKQQGDMIRADVTELVKNNDTFTIYAAGAVDGVTAGGSALTTPKDEGLKDNAMFLTISYDKLAFANEVGKASNAEAAQSLVENYRTILGIPEDADTMAYAVAMMGTEFTSAAQLESVFERAALREVMIADVMPQPGQISRGSVTIRNLTAEVKDIQVVVAGYNENGQMVDSVFLTLANPQLNGYTSVSGLYRMSADNIVEIKAFLWDSLESLQPLDMPGVYRQQ